MQLNTKDVGSIPNATERKRLFFSISYIQERIDKTKQKKSILDTAKHALTCVHTVKSHSPTPCCVSPPL